jgi:hypothetical protein
MPLNRNTPRPRNILVLLVPACVVAASCGSEDPADLSATTDPAATVQIAGTVKPAESVASTSTGPPTTIVDVDTSVDASAPPDDAERRPIRSDVPLAAGAYRSTGLAGPGLALDVDLPQDGLVALDSEGAFFLATDATGEEVLLVVWHLDNGAAVEPGADLVQLADQEYARQVSSPVPADALAWLASRPGVSAGPLGSGDIGGTPARQQSFRFGLFDGALPCSPGDTDLCHVLIWAPPTGIAYTLAIGDEPLLVSELVVGGHRLAVMQDLDIAPELAAELAASLRLTAIAHPAAPADARPLPFAGPLEAGTAYVHERSTGGVWLVPGADGVTTIADFLRDRFVRFGDGAAECGSITDGTQGRWFGREVSPDGTALDGTEIPPDLVGAITSSPALQIVAGPTTVDLGEVDGTSIDIAPTGTADVVLANSSHRAVTGATTRVIVAPRPDGGPDLVVVTLDTACAALLDGLTFLPGAER